MANQVAARLAGDDYQHLYAWQFVLELRMPARQVRRVTVEDPFAGSVDDITIQHEEGVSKPDLFYQIKYHVDQRGAYSTAYLIEAKPGETSLLQKFWNTWKLLKQQSPERTIELHLVSNWSWDPKDKLKNCIDGRDNRLKGEFYSASPRTEVGKLRQRLQHALQAGDEDFNAFAHCLRFRLGFDCGEELEARVAERMENLGLKSDRTAILVAIGIVREWIKAGRQALTRDDLENVIKTHELVQPAEAERCVTIYLSTIKDQAFDIEPDHILDWREYFAGPLHKRGHQLIYPEGWNSKLLPELNSLEEQVNQETNCRLVRARGLARLSAWFAFGFAFSEVARYTIEVDQGGQFWRTDAPPSEDFRVITTSKGGFPDGEELDGQGSTVAIGISVTGALDDDVRDYFADRSEQVAALLLLRPDRELGRACLRSASDAVSLADEVKEYMRGFVKRWKAERLLVFYFGPLSGACFLGHRLNAVCQTIQIMEDQQPGYAPSFLLS